MEGKKGDDIRIEEDINGRDGSNSNSCRSLVVADGDSGSPTIFAEQTCDGNSSLDSFYERLCRLNEPSGLSIIFNFREARFDLYLFYKEVTGRGGFDQVTKDGRWGEVASAVNLKSSVTVLASQLHKLYETVLYLFEQIDYYRTPPKVTKAQGGKTSTYHSSGSEGNSYYSLKRKRSNSTSPSSTPDSGLGHSLEGKRELYNSSCQLPAGLPLGSCVTSGLQIQAVPSTMEQTSSRNKALKKYPRAPLRYRSAYQMLLKMEWGRLKEIHGKRLGNQTMRKIASDAWKSLSENDQQPYMEASIKDKERYKQEMAAY